MVVVPLCGLPRLYRSDWLHQSSLGSSPRTNKLVYPPVLETVGSAHPPCGRTRPPGCALGGRVVGPPGQASKLATGRSLLEARYTRGILYVVIPSWLISQRRLS